MNKIKYIVTILLALCVTVPAMAEMRKATKLPFQSPRSERKLLVHSGRIEEKHLTKVKISPEERKKITKHAEEIKKGLSQSLSRAAELAKQAPQCKCAKACKLPRNLEDLSEPELYALEEAYQEYVNTINEGEPILPFEEWALEELQGCTCPVCNHQPLSTPQANTQEPACQCEKSCKLPQKVEDLAPGDLYTLEEKHQKYVENAINNNEAYLPFDKWLEKQLEGCPCGCQQHQTQLTVKPNLPKLKPYE